MSIENLTNSEYHAKKAISHSLLVKGRQSVMYAYMESVFNPDYKDDKNSDALIVGNLYHTLIRCPEIIENRKKYIDAYNNAYALYQAAKEKKRQADIPFVEIGHGDGRIIIADFGKSRRNVAYENVCSLIGSGIDDYVINIDEFKNTCDMVRCLMAHPCYKGIHAGCEVVGNEISIFNEINGIPYKVRIDRLLKINDKYIIIDWKTTKEYELAIMQKSGQRMGYDTQAELYRYMVAMEYDIPLENVDMIFLYQCKEYPLIVHGLRFNKESIEHAKMIREMVAEDFMDRLNRGNGYVDFMPVQSDIVEFKHYEDALLDQSLIF